MNGAETAAAALRQWLQTAHGYQYILQLADRLKKESRWRAGLSICFRHRFSSDPDDLRNEIAQEFISFLLQKFLPRLNDMPDQVNAVLTGQARKVLSFALQQFSWRLQDNARRKDVSPRTYLYRRLREELQRDNRFVVQQYGQNGMCCLPASLDIATSMAPADFSQVEYGRWPVPPEPADRKALFTAKYLTEAAGFFLEEATRQNTATEPVPVREIVRYLAAHFPWLNGPRQEELPGNDYLAAPAQSSEEQFIHIAVLESIGALADQFVLLLDDEARKILCWTLEDPPLSYKEIGRKLNFPDHNRPYRIHRKTIGAMRRFCADWPGPPLSELPDEVGIAFIEAVRKKCKKSIS